MRFLHLLFFITLAAASPLLRQQTPETPPDVEPDAELIPSAASPTPSITPTSSPPSSPSPITSPSPTFLQPSLTPIPTQSPTQTPVTSPQPSVSPTFTPPSSPSPSPSTDGLPPPSVVPGDTDDDGIPDDDEPEPTPFIEGGDSNRAALAGGLTGGLFGLLLLILCIFCVFWRKKDDTPSAPVYTSSEAGVGPSPDGETTTDATSAPIPLEKDEARDMGPVAGGAVAAAATGAGVAAATPGEDDAPVVARGPTPPPHDYVLGAGPATTRKDFVDLRTKFERDEIGDNSAVLGMERDGVIGEGLETDISTTGAGVGVGAEAAAAAAVVGSTALPRETETAPGVDIKPENLPDRGGPVPMTFESQERLMAGGDGSGAISDVAMSLNAGSIAEESGDVPSLERDPIIRDRDQTF